MSGSLLGYGVGVGVDVRVFLGHGGRGPSGTPVIALVSMPGAGKG